MPYLTSMFGNPSGIHRVGPQMLRSLSTTRAPARHAAWGAAANELYFTSGGSESDAWILRGRRRTV